MVSRNGWNVDRVATQKPLILAASGVNCIWAASRTVPARLTAELGDGRRDAAVRSWRPFSQLKRSMSADWASRGSNPSLPRHDRVRKDTVSKKIGNGGTEPCFFAFVGFISSRLVGLGAPSCHDRLLVQYLERSGHPRDCERSFIHSASCKRDLQPAGLQRGMWQVRTNDQDDHRRSCGSNAVCARVGGALKTPPAAHRLGVASQSVGLPK
jgi:hypothetical protein